MSLTFFFKKNKKIGEKKGGKKDRDTTSELGKDKLLFMMTKTTHFATCNLYLCQKDHSSLFI